MYDVDGSESRSDSVVPLVPDWVLLHAILSNGLLGIGKVKVEYGVLGVLNS